MRHFVFAATIAAGIAASCGNMAEAQQTATPLAEVEQGMQMFLRGHYDSADQEFSAALQQNPSDPLASLWKGIAEAALQRPGADFSWLLVGDDGVVGGAVQELRVLYSWRRGDIASAKTYLHNCIYMGDVRWRAGCEDLEHGVDSGASAPPVKDWPADVGLIKVTKARATVWKPTQQ